MHNRKSQREQRCVERHGVDLRGTRETWLAVRPVWKSRRWGARSSGCFVVRRERRLGAQLRVLLVGLGQRRRLMQRRASTWSQAGGTSFASPIMAGIQALVNQRAGSPQGNPNGTYYAL